MRFKWLPWLLIMTFMTLILLTYATIKTPPDLGTDEEKEKLPPNKVVQEPTEGGSITLGLNIEPLHLDPLGFKLTQTSLYNIDSIIYRGLFKYNDNLQLAPDLIASFAIDPEENKIKMTLKENVAWQDGTPISIEDIQYTIEWYSQRAYNGRWKQYTFHIQGVEAYRIGEAEHISGIISSPEEQSITIYYDQLDVNDLQLLIASILSKAQLSGKSMEEVKELAKSGKLLATGPYKIGEINDSNWTLIRNDYYEEMVYLDEVIFTDYDENQDVDLLIGLPYQVNKKKGSKKLITLAGNGYQYLGMNLNAPVWQDLSTRRAIALAIDYQAIIKDIYQGYADQPLSPIHPQSWAYAAIEIKSDRKEAKNILNGQDITLDLAFADQPFNQKLAEEIAKQLDRLGITIQLRPIAADAYIPTLFSQGAFDLFLASWPYALDPVEENEKWLSENDVALGGYNVSHVQDEMSDKMLKIGRSTLNMEKRKGIYGQWQDHFMNQFYYLPLASPRVILLAEPTLHVEMNNSLLPYANIQHWWIEK